MQANTVVTLPTSLMILVSTDNKKLESFEHNSPDEVILYYSLLIKRLYREFTSVDRFLAIAQCDGNSDCSRVGYIIVYSDYR